MLTIARQAFRAIDDFGFVVLPPLAPPQAISRHIAPHPTACRTTSRHVTPCHSRAQRSTSTDEGGTSKKKAKAKRGGGDSDGGDNDVEDDEEDDIDELTGDGPLDLKGIKVDEQLLEVSSKLVQVHDHITFRTVTCA